MATATNVLIEDLTATQSNYTFPASGSVTPVAGRAYLALVMSRQNLGTAATPTLTGTGGFNVTWTQVQTQTSGGSLLLRATLFRGVASSNTAGAFTVAHSANQLQSGISVDEWSGVDTTTNQGVVQSATGAGSTNGALAVTLAAFSSALNPTWLGGDARGSPSGYAPEASYTAASITGGIAGMASAWLGSNDTSPTGTLTSGSNWAAIAVEMAASSGSTPIAGTDTLAPQLTETATRRITVKVADTFAVILTETAVRPSLSSRVSDTLPVRLSEVVSGSFGTVPKAATDALGVRLSEVVRVSVVQRRTDTLAPQLTEAATAPVLLRVTDTVAPKLTDAGRATVAVRRTDTFRVLLTEGAVGITATTPTTLPGLRVEAVALIELASASGTWHLATRPIELPAVMVPGLDFTTELGVERSQSGSILLGLTTTTSLSGYQGRLRRAPTVRTSLQDAFWGPIEYQEIDFEVDNSDGALTADYLGGLSGRTVISSRYDPVTLERLDWWVGVVSQPALGLGVVRVRASNLNLAALDPLVPRGTIDAATFPKADNCYGQTIPVTIGTVPNCPLALVNRDDVASVYDYLVGRGTPTAVLKARAQNNGPSFAIPTSRTVIPLTVSSQASAGSSSTFAHTVAGSDRCLLVGVSLAPGVGNQSVSTITYNGVALTKLGATANGTAARAEWWVLMVPPVGTFSVVVTLTGAAAAYSTAFGLTGVDPTMVAADFDYAAATGTSASPSRTMSAAVGMQVFDVVSCSADAAESAGAGQIQLSGGAQLLLDGFTSIQPGAASTTMHWTLGASFIWATAVVTVRPAPNYVLNTTAYAGLTVARFNYPQVDTSGNALQYVADITGLTVERSPGRAVKTLLADTGWGLSYPTGSNPYTGLGFNASAALVPAELRLDVWMGEAKPAKAWLSEWLMLRGMRLGVNASGQWYLWVDTAQTVKLAVGDGGGDGPRNLVAIGERQPGALADRVAAVRVHYRPDHLNGGTLQYSYTRDVFAPEGQERPYDFPSIRDHTAGDLLTCYLARRLFYGDETVPLTINGVQARALLEADLITLTVPLMAYLGDTLELSHVEKNLADVSAEARGWNALTYVYTPGTLNTDPTPDPPTPPIDLTPAVGGYLPVGPVSLQVGVWGKQALVYVVGEHPTPWDYTNLYASTTSSFASAVLKDSGKRDLFHLDDLDEGTSYFFFATYVSDGVESLPQPTVPTGGVSPTTITPELWATGDIGVGAVATANIAAAAASNLISAAFALVSDVGGTLFDIPGASIAITTIGAPVFISASVYVIFNTAGSGPARQVVDVEVDLYRDGGFITGWVVGQRLSNSADDESSATISVSWVDVPTAGVHTYALKIQAFGSISDTDAIFNSSDGVLTVVEFRR